QSEVVEGVQEIVEAEGTLRMAMDLSRVQADPSVYANDARGIAASHQLDFLDLVGDDGVLISSAQWPGRIGFKNDWVALQKDWNQQGAFLGREELPDNVELALLAVRVVHVADKNLYIIGGQRLDRDSLQSVVVPAGMRILLYRNLETAFVPAALSDAAGQVSQADRFAPIVESAQRKPLISKYSIQWATDAASTEAFTTL